MGRVLLLLLLIHLALAFAVIVDCYGGEESPARLSRLVWSLIAVFGVVVGPVTWFAYGRPGRRLSMLWNESTGPRPVAPDDDPDFLEELGRRAGPPPQRPNSPNPTTPPPQPQPGAEPPTDGAHVERDTNDTAPDERNNGPA
jgi:hypothetical protein